MLKGGPSLGTTMASFTLDCRERVDCITSQKLHHVSPVTLRLSVWAPPDAAVGSGNWQAIMRVSCAGSDERNASYVPLAKGKPGCEVEMEQ